MQHHSRLLRDVLAAFLERQPGLTLVGITAHSEELLKLCGLQHPDIALIEADASPGEAATLTAELRSRHPQMHIIGLYESLAPDDIVRTYRAGASRLVSYSSGIGPTLAALYAPPESVTGLVSGRHRVTLTERELEILYLISAGCTLREMSASLGISPRTVENYKRRIFAKLDVHSQAHATASAAHLGLLRPPETRGSGRMLPPEPEPPAPSRDAGPDVTAAVRGPDDALVDDVTRMLHQGGVKVVHSGGGWPPQLCKHSVVAVLVDPEPEDWRCATDLGLRVVLVTPIKLDQAALVEVVLQGADAVVTTDDAPCQLVSAFRLVGEGYMLIDGAQLRPLVDATWARMAGTRPVWPLELTPREQQILASIDQGHSVKQTARLLGISVRTVENLQSRLFRKLGARNRAGALAVAHGLGILDPRSAIEPD